MDFGEIAMSMTTRQIAELVGGTLEGPGELSISGMERLDRATAEHLTLVTDGKYAKGWSASGAKAALVGKGVELEVGEGRAAIWVGDVDLAVAKVLEAIAPPVCQPMVGVHGSAVVESSAVIGTGARIGANCYVGHKTRIGAGAVLHPNVTVLDDCVIGEGVVLWPGVVIRERCSVGERSILHPNVSVGGDGFGYRPAPNGKGIIKIPQIGTVTIGRDVEIGSGTCIDRAKFGTTEIGDGCKLDNMVQIAHNCTLGKCVIIAGCTGVAGSATLGDGVVIGGCAIIRDHTTIGAGAKIAGGACVMNDVPAGETWGGYPAKDAKMALREYVAMKHLPDLVRQMKRANRPSSS